jgi:putative ABC transport system permease protein
MLLWMAMRMSLRSLAAHKARATLSIVGVMIGVGSVIAMLSIGAGAREEVLRPIVAMGKNLLIVRPAPLRGAGVISGIRQNLTVANAKALLTVSDITAVAPVVSQNRQVEYMNRNTNVDIIGTCTAYLDIRNFSIAEGRMFSDVDAADWRRVCILGLVTATKLFGLSDPIDQIIKIAGINFRVIGVIAAKGDQGWFNPDEQVIVPYTTAMHQLLGVHWLQEIDVQVRDGVDLDDIQSNVAESLRRLHHVQLGEDDDVQIENQAELIRTTNQIMTSFTVLIGSMAGICLLVGGIGIMNIMLVSVTERTAEIGVRKAVGARDADILGQFLMEALLLSALGGLLGVGLGAIGTWFVSEYTPFPSIVEPYSIVLALGFSAGVGIFFGFYPAVRASKLNPIEALRYE